MFILGILFGITNGTCRFLWGFLLDKYGFKKLMFCIIPLYTQIYGMDAGPRMYALCGACIGLAQFCCPLLVKFFLKKKKDYLITFLFAGSLCLIKFIFLLFFDDKEKIDVHSKYNNENENKDDNKKDLLIKN